MGTISEKLQYLATTKQNNFDALAEKGVTIPEGATFRDQADLIRSISTGGGGSSGGGSSSGGGATIIDSGYTINFHDFDGNLIQSVSALCGMWVDKPISFNCEMWSNSEGLSYSFPLTVDIDNAGHIADVYASGYASCAYELYKAYGVSEKDYPYIVVGFNGARQRFWFANSAIMESVYGVYYLKLIGLCYVCNESIDDFTSSNDLTEYYINANMTFSGVTEDYLRLNYFIHHNSDVIANLIASYDIPSLDLNELYTK